MSPDLLWQVPLMLWAACMLVAALTHEDFGRVVTLKREIHDAAELLAVLPILIVALVVLAPIFLLLDLRTQKSKGDRSEPV